MLTTFTMPSSAGAWRTPASCSSRYSDIIRRSLRARVMQAPPADDVYPPPCKSRSEPASTPRLKDGYFVEESCQHISGMRTFTTPSSAYFSEYAGFLIPSNSLACRRSHLNTACCRRSPCLGQHVACGTPPPCVSRRYSPLPWCISHVHTAVLGVVLVACRLLVFLEVEVCSRVAGVIQTPCLASDAHNAVLGMFFAVRWFPGPLDIASWYLLSRRCITTACCERPPCHSQHVAYSTPPLCPRSHDSVDSCRSHVNTACCGRSLCRPQRVACRTLVSCLHRRTTHAARTLRRGIAFSPPASAAQHVERNVPDDTVPAKSPRRDASASPGRTVEHSCETFGRRRHTCRRLQNRR